MAPPVSRRYYTVREVATILGVSGKKVRRLIEDGLVPATRLGGTWQIPISQFERKFGG